MQRRREFPTRATQALQIFLRNRVIGRMLDPAAAAPALRLLRRWPILRRFPARLIGLGIRPEHVAVPAAPAPR